MFGRWKLIASVFMIGIGISIGGLRAQTVTYGGCTDLYGVAVASIQRDVNNVAIATRLPGSGAPVIYYNPSVLSWFKAPTRLFWYGHECAHHKLGHTIGYAFPLTAEQAADCWSIKTLYDAGLIDDQEVCTIATDMHKTGPGDWTHLPGSQRGINLFACLGRSSWCGSSHSVPAVESSSTELCSAVSQIISSAGTRFSSVRGAADGTGDFAGKVIPHGFDHCTAWADKKSYSCRTKVDLGEAEMRSVFENLLRDLGDCLSAEWKKKDRTSSSGHRSAYFKRTNQKISIAVRETYSKKKGLHVTINVDRE